MDSTGDRRSITQCTLGQTWKGLRNTMKDIDRIKGNVPLEILKVCIHEMACLELDAEDKASRVDFGTPSSSCLS